MDACYLNQFVYRSLVVIEEMAFLFDIIRVIRAICGLIEPLKSLKDTEMIDVTLSATNAYFNYTALSSMDLMLSSSNFF
jgi:hypothetical protein